MPAQTGSTPLHAAAAAGHADCVRILIAAGADKDALARARATPAHRSPFPLLLTDTKNSSGTTSPRPSLACIPRPTHPQHGKTPLHIAAEWGRAACVRALAKGGANLQARDELVRLNSPSALLSLPPLAFYSSFLSPSFPPLELPSSIILSCPCHADNKSHLPSPTQFPFSRRGEPHCTVLRR